MTMRMFMAPFYKTDARRAAVIAEARSWLGTPFSENCAVKGLQGGVSCDRYQLAVHAAAGACPLLELPVLPVEQVRRWHEHNADSRILGWLGSPKFRGRARRVDEGAAPMIGDIVVLRIKETEHHLGLWAGAEIFHVAIPAGVLSHSARDPELLKLIRCYYRIYE